MRKMMMALAIAGTTAPLLETAASAHRTGYAHSHNRSYDGGNYRHRCSKGSGTTGLILGGAAGALLGRTLDGGRDRTLGTVAGAAGGALLGREIQRSSRGRRC